MDNKTARKLLVVGKELVSEYIGRLKDNAIDNEELVKIANRLAGKENGYDYLLKHPKKDVVHEALRELCLKYLNKFLLEKLSD